VFTDARLIDGVADTAREHVDVVVGDDGRIASIAPHEPRHWSGHDAADDLEVIGAAGHTLLAGFVDVHVHYTIDARLETPDGILDALTQDPATAAFIGAGNARRALYAGVTTARSAGAAHSRDIPLRDAINAGHIEGPWLSAAGGSITITGGHGWQFGYEADGPQEMVKLARSLARDGADHFKIVSSEAAQITSAVAGAIEMTPDEIKAVVDEARRLHRTVMSHAQPSAAVVASARGGVDSVEHAFLADRAALEVVKDCGTTLTPTLTVTDVWSSIPGVGQDIVDNQKRLSVTHRRSAETAVELGIPLTAGTDCGVRGVSSEMLWREIWNLHDHGLSAMDAIKAGTVNGARVLGLAEDRGTIEPGKRADIVMVWGDPLTDLKRLSNLALVMKAGSIVRRTA
jgi:imidazolonepropionase-like amidohydrolase